MMITFREVKERIERGDSPEIIREFLEEAARSGEMFDSELVRFICNGFGGEENLKMNIYKIWADGCLGYNTYDSAIVVAKDEETARHIHPGSTPGNPVVGYNAETYRYDKAWYESDDFFPYLVWTKPEYVKAEFIGTTDLFPEGTVLCASYNAG